MTRFVRTRVLLPLFLLYLLAGCRSHVIVVTVTNHSGAEMRNLEVNYPGGSFGKESLASGESCTYRIKTLRSGEFTIAFEDAGGHAHAKKGPKLNGNQEGSLNVDVQPAEVSFSLR
jgi:hypothetical protein